MFYVVNLWQYGIMPLKVVKFRMSNILLINLHKRLISSLWTSFTTRRSYINLYENKGSSVLLQLRKTGLKANTENSLKIVLIIAYIGKEILLNVCFLL